MNYIEEAFIMKLAVKDVEYRLNDLQGQIYAACRLGAWCFGENHYLYQGTTPHVEEYQMFLQAGGSLQLAFNSEKEEPLPCIISGNLGLAWIAEWVNLQQGGSILVLLGPAYLKNTPLEHSLQGLDRIGVSQHLRRQYYNVLSDVPVLSFEMLRQYACILHYTCYQETCRPVTAAPPKKEKEERQPEEAHAGADSNDFRRMAEYEELLLRHLAAGEKLSEEETSYSGELQSYSMRDSMREIKDNILIFTGLCSRTASKNGVPVYAARKAESEWVRRIEAASTFSELKKIREEMYNSFLRLIRQQKDGSGMSRAVRECRSYIQANYMNEISLEDIARHCGYAEYYLSRKFSKETGMKLGDYIHSVRVEAAKVMLVTTRKDIQEISDMLHFGNRNHFDRIFRQQTGVSPAQFREGGGLIRTSQ